VHSIDASHPYQARSTVSCAPSVRPVLLGDNGPDGALAVDVDLANGGRWTSLRLGGDEWLWRRDAPDRCRATPGSPFVDGGGMEECIPTVRGRPDHGDAWCRPWTGDGRRATVTTAEFSLTRTLSATAGRLTADYALAAAPGYRFVWAAHVLLELSAQATLECEPGVPVRVFGRGESWVYHSWPDDDGLHLDRLGPDDGTAVSAIVEIPRMLIRDGPRCLHLAVQGTGQPTSIGIWRNLRGWPMISPYRSIGVEPMLGRVWDRATGSPEDTAVTDTDGLARWRMTLALTRGGAA
jgi:hypothetical protein